MWETFNSLVLCLYHKKVLGSDCFELVSGGMSVMDNAQLEYPSHPLETLACCNGT